MITLTKTLKNDRKAISIRDRLLVTEVIELEQNLPETCTTHFSDPNVLHEFNLVVCPNEGYWHSGRFTFSLFIPEDYNMMPPIVKCLTKLWHPNISVEGGICLSLLRPNSIDGLGWTPTRRLKDVAWGLNSLFTDLLNFDDPLNIEAAELYERDRVEFQIKVRDYVRLYATD